MFSRVLEVEAHHFSKAATPEYLRYDFLKPQQESWKSMNRKEAAIASWASLRHLPIERVDEEANFAAASNINETRFHKDIQFEAFCERRAKSRAERRF